MNNIGFLLPETHFLRPVVFFMQCYLKIVDEYLWFSFPGNALLTRSSILYAMSC